MQAASIDNGTRNDSYQAPPHCPLCHAGNFQNIQPAFSLSESLIITFISYACGHIFTPVQCEQARFDYRPPRNAVDGAESLPSDDYYQAGRSGWRHKPPLL